MKILIVLIVAMFAVTGCQRHAANTASEPVSARPMRVVTDDLGRTVQVPTKLNRVISLAPNLTEMIFAAGGGDRLVGVTTFCNYPAEAEQIAKIGDTLNPNMESIIALKPDVVFVSTASQVETFTKTLEKDGIAVYVANAASLADVFHSMDEFGIMFDTVEQSQKTVDELKGRVQSVRQTLGTDLLRDESPADHDKRVGAVRVFVQISKEPLFTIGKDAFLNDILVSAGGRSVTENVPSSYPKLSKETAFTLQPEAIILSDSTDNTEPNAAFKNSPAVKNGRVYKINADLLSRPGPRLVDALEQIVRDLHPEKFN